MQVKKVLTILVIEDDKYITEYLDIVLKEHNYRLIQCDTGKKGYEYSLKEQPDLILLDLMLPDISGYDVLDNLKKDTRTFSIPVIILTALSQSESIKRCQQLGAVDYIIKPFEMSELFSKIEKHTHTSDKIKIRKITDKIIIELSGNVSNIEVNKLKHLLVHFISQNVKNIIIDFTNVSFLDDSINLVLLSAKSKINYLKGKISLVSPSNNKKVLSKLTEHFQKSNLIYETTALASRG